MSRTIRFTRTRTAVAPTGLAVALLVGAALPLVVAPSPVAAHSVLLESLPQDGAVLAEPPTEIKLRFNEDVSVVDDATQLTDEDGTTVQTEVTVSDKVVTITPEPVLSAGAFELAYRVVSADSHPIGGTVAFEVEAAAEPTPSAETTSAGDAAGSTDGSTSDATSGTDDDSDDESDGASLTVVALAGAAGLVVGTLFVFLRRRR